MKFNNMKTVVKSLLLAATAIFAVSCVVDEADYTSDVDLGANIVDDKGKVVRELNVTADAGSLEIEVFSNKTYKVEVVKGADWVSVKETPASGGKSEMMLSGDGKFYVNYDRNARFRRMGQIVLSAETRVDTIRIKQVGPVDATIELPDSRVFLDKNGGDVRIRFISKLDFKDINIEVDYADPNETGWLSDFERVNNFLTFRVSDNYSELPSRKAVVTFSYTDDWGELVSDKMSVMQNGANSDLGTTISFEELRQMEGRITEPICIEGYIVSDVESGNAADNPHTSKTTIDYTHTNMCGYIESLDGKYGIRMEFDKPDDYVFRRYDKVKLNLQGAVITREGSTVAADSNPIRYALSDLTEENVITVEGCSSAQIPAKIKHFKELTDDDMYTYVQLSDCEFPIRKGPRTPINEGYAKTYNSNRISKYPMLVRDINGNSFYTYTNITCPYRRNGQPMPQGSGILAGVIVFEHYDRFEWDIEKCTEYQLLGFDEDQILELGNIGRYQIRHQSQDDIQIAEDFNSGFSNIICEFAYYNYNRTEVQKTVDDHYVLSASYGSGTITHSSGSATDTGIRATSAYCYLGPCGSGYNKNENGSGVKDIFGKEVMTTDGDGSTNVVCKGMAHTNDGLAWRHTKWVNGTDYHYWLITFSTKNVARGRNLSLQIGTSNGSQGGAPRYWNVDWSSNGESWANITTYSVPDFVYNTYCTYFQTGGTKYINVTLPDEMAGLATVYIRLKPAENRAGATEAPYGYADAQIVDGKTNTLDYVAVRYNK